ncbi:phosphonate metabolism transcriptional regulator PhnF (plasmid) [Paracoccus versutus]|uniref:GntR family phosphonate transport system transcriptional regulator n=1 Tax=Paracoccus versutus TaxID=34007 RepID=A0AAQ0KL69_PARVE|nr:phosphonate metabolism transcriptional regulator PhnF [Paracoccus versutus]REG39584.1 GntR family phosphonate transport system transcriptional regulator [Paracoccus versutus]WEJ80813.1 phosphonate metabolism transcriptional regulator PhnF [Paracoccus versutus]
MARSPIWKSIADTLAAEIAEGHYRPGDKLPSEAVLAARFGVNRHTVRHALAALAEAGTLRSRRGAGVFVAARPTDYPLGLRVRFHQNITASGRTPSRRLTLAETRAANAEEAEALHLAPGSPVHVVEGVSLVDGQPVAAFRSVFDAGRFPELLRHVAAIPSVTAALAECGLKDYTRASTRLTAELAPAVMALALEVPEGAPMLRSVAVNVDAGGVPVEYGTTWFAGDRVTLTLRPEDGGQGVGTLPSTGKAARNS